MQKIYKRFCLIAVSIFCFCFTFHHAAPAQELIPDPSWNFLDSGGGSGFNASVQAVVSGAGGTYFVGKFNRFNLLESGNCARFSPGPGGSLLRDPLFPKIFFQNGSPEKTLLTNSNRLIITGTFTSVTIDQSSIPCPGRVFVCSLNGSPDMDFINLINSINGPEGKIRDAKWINSQLYLIGDSASGTTAARCFLKRIAGGGSSFSQIFSFPLNPGDSINTFDIAENESFVLVGGRFSLIPTLALPTKSLFRCNIVPGVISPSPSFSAPAATAVQIVHTIKLLPGDTLALIAGRTLTGAAQIRRIRANLGTNASSPADLFSANSEISQIYPSGTAYIAAGRFSYSTAAITRHNLALFAANGTLLTEFEASSPLGRVNSLTGIAGSKLLIAGEFKGFGQRPRRYAVLSDTLGNLIQPALYSNMGANDTVFAQVVHPNGKIYAGGAFNGYNDSLTNWNGIACILPSGLADPAFSPGAGFNGKVFALATDAGQRILAGGRFNAYSGVNGLNGIIRILSNGSIDGSFNAGTGTTDSVLCIAVQADGKILLGGSFTTFNGLPCNRLVRLNASGSIDAAFLASTGSGFNGTVRSIVLSGSLIYAGGDFSAFNGNSRNGIVRLNANGSLDGSFNPGTGINPGGVIRKIYRSPANGGLYAGGRFSQYNGQNRSNLVKILAGGQPDPGYNPQLNPNGIVHDLLDAEAGRGLIVSGENLSQAKAGPSKGLIKLKPKGGTAFSIGSNGPVLGLKRDSSGKIIVTGDFNQLDTLGKNRVARITETALETTIWGGSDWDWDAPDCDFSALINGDYENQPGFTCKTLTILPAKKFFPDSTVWICRNAYNYGNQISGRVYLKDLNADTVHQVEGIFDDVTLDDDSGAVVTDPVTIRGTLKLKKGIFSTSNQLTLRSTAAKTGRIGKIESGADISGQVTMERFVPGGTAGWHFLGTPIKNQVQGNWADDFLILPNFIYHHDEGLLTDSGWVQTTDSLSIGRGFRVWLNQPFFNSQATFRNTGIPHTGNFNFNVSYSPGGYGGGGWNFLANPYPSEIDWHAFAKTNVGNEIHYWNGNIYGSYNSVTEVGVNGAGRSIPSSQAFFVKASASGPALSVTESAKPDSALNPTFLRSAVNVAGQVARIRLKGSNLPDDETAIRWMDGVQNEFEDESDSRKLRNPGLNIYSLTSDGRRSSIQARMSGLSDSVHFGLSVPAPGNYLLDIRLGEDLLTDKNWFIFDHAEKSYNRISAGTELPFPVAQNETEFGKRFTLFARPLEEEVPELIENRDFIVFPNPSRDEVRIFGMQKEESFLLEHSSGKLVLKGSTNGLIQVKGLSPGLYILHFPESNSFRERLKILIAH